MGTVLRLLCSVVLSEEKAKVSLVEALNLKEEILKKTAVVLGTQKTG